MFLMSRRSLSIKIQFYLVWKLKDALVNMKAVVPLAKLLTRLVMWGEGQAS